MAIIDIERGLPCSVYIFTAIQINRCNHQHCIFVFLGFVLQSDENIYGPMPLPSIKRTLINLDI